eukprot:779683-Karenia_brevis.AAC.1
MTHRVKRLLEIKRAYPEWYLPFVCGLLEKRHCKQMVVDSTFSSEARLIWTLLLVKRGLKP